MAVVVVLGALIEAGCVAAAALLAVAGGGTACSAFFAAAGEQADVADDDFGAVDLFVGLLVVPASCCEASFDVEFVALLYVVADDLGEFAVGGEVVPLGLVLPVALLVLVALAGGEAEVGDGLAAWEDSDLFEEVFAGFRRSPQGLKPQ